MRASKTLLRMAALVTSAIFAGCGGGGGISIEGNVNVAPPPIPPLQGSEAITVHGEITGLGSITVNDVRFQTGTASVTVNGDPALLIDLQLGQVVTLRGRINTDGRTGTANSVRFDANVIGPVDGLDATNRQLVVLGQTVTTDASTRFAGGIDSTTYDGLAPGDVALISGHADAAGVIRATWIGPAPDNAEMQLIGRVSSLDLDNHLFQIGRLTVDYDSALLIDLPDGMPADGMRVRIVGAMTAGRFEVERLLSAPALSGASGQRVQTAGVVTRFGSATDFDLGNVSIAANTATTYHNGVRADLGRNAEVMVDGHFTATGRIAARRITFGRSTANTASLAFGFRDFTEISVPSVFNVTVSQGDDFTVEVLVDQDHDHRVDVTQTGPRLAIALLPGNGNIHTLDAHVTMPVLERIDLSGVARANLQGFEQSRMTIHVGGVSHLRGHGLDIRNLTASVTGVSRLDLVDVRPLSNASVDISGVSQATLNMDAGSTLSGAVRTGQGTGISTLFYYGTNVDVSVTTDSWSSVVRLGDTRT